MLAPKALERLELEVIPERDGLEALARWEREGPFDLGLIDFRMPSLDGLEGTPSASAPPMPPTSVVSRHLVALTANAGENDQRAALGETRSFLAKAINLRAPPALLDGRSEPADEVVA